MLEIQDIDQISKELSSFTDEFIGSLKQPNDFFDIIEKKYRLYYDCIMKFLAFDEVLKIEIEVEFKKLNGSITRQLEAFRKHAHTKTICMLNQGAFTSVKSSCDSLRPNMQKRLGALEKRAETLIQRAVMRPPIATEDKVEQDYLNCVIKVVQVFWNLEQSISLAFDADNFSGYLAKITEAISDAETLTNGTLQCHGLQAINTLK
ncbi:PREDICTED: uncharacterized protein LOC109582395 [Amphimedon queenslandica]|uniref:Uncharacterized protein n=2 Tax=Amphimedon queenslandica TaxID=400682 RepID=A0AAN0J7C4_AMPQE|nr:PREDICTED: uncharacterized protein LOC109582395 [Amphimedon queenslandica]|eukprot:XP_019852636.1 PREDICTED: uncharacterized protein LOC109582395 [Amphimedon queenslandica]